MNNKEKIYNIVLDKCKNISIEDILIKRRYGVNADEISDSLKIARPNVSSTLNELVKEGLLIKIISRPVFYIAKEKLESITGFMIEKEIKLIDLIEMLKRAEEKDDDVFKSLIGHNGSLRKQVEQAKAAVLYPLHGLHTLIIGPPGSGKSYLAEVMYKFRERCGMNGSFETLNCADYYNNPQLLMSYLFGHVKGAYTGAESEKNGLVEKANGGLLFLDEVHRLPPEGQEMLFYLIDKGIYHRLGDTSEKKVNLMIIAATTEKPDSSLLKTFLRRIPVVIKMPSLDERPICEKVEIVKMLFKEEAKRTNLNILIYPDIFSLLLNCKFEGNVGELKSMIQLLCAKAFLRNYSNKENILKVDITMLPDNFKYIMQKKQGFETNEFIIISPDGKENLLDKYDLYESIIEKYRILEQSGLNKGMINEKINSYINNFFESILKK